MENKYFNRCFNLTKRLCKIPSINGTRGEATLAEFLYHYLSTRPEIKNLGLRVEMVEIPGENHRKAVMVFMPAKAHSGAGSSTFGADPPPAFQTEHPAVVLMGHFDTVGVDEYGQHKNIASDSARLRQVFEEDQTIPQDVRHDLEGGEFEFGRGWLDMKSGVAAIVEVFIEFAKNGGAEGSLILALCPDEEGGSAGVRALAPRINSILKSKKLKLRCVVNADYVSPLDQSDSTRAVYTGTIGKYLMLISVFGREAHAGQVWESINAAAVAGWLASNLESDPQLADQLAQEVTAPPATLYLKDGSESYTVMTPPIAHFLLNQFAVKVTPDQIITKYINRIRGFTRHWLERRIKRFERFSGGGGKGRLLDLPMSVIDLTGLVEQAQRVSQIEDFATRLAEVREEFAAKEYDERRACMRTVEWLVQTAKAAPCIVVSFAPPFYPSNYLLGEERDFVANAAERAFAKAAEGERMEIRKFYPFISDMSYFSFPEAPVRTSHWRHLVENMAYPMDLQEWALLSELNSPVINIGPYGHGAHTIYERVERDWTFGRLPQVIEQMVSELHSVP